MELGTSKFSCCCRRVSTLVCWNTLSQESEHGGSEPINLGLQEKEQSMSERFLLGLSVNVTAMFRDPSFYLKQGCTPLQTYIRIWHAGCSTSEEVY